MNIIEKQIGGVSYRNIDGKWHQLSDCGFIWVECDQSTSWAVNGWVC